MNLEKIQNLWEEDSVIDPDNLHIESIKIPMLHSKYHNIYNSILILKRAEEDKYKQTKFSKWQYYTGKVPPDDPKSQRCDHKVMKQDLDKYMDSDEDIRKIVAKLNYYDAMLNFLDSILRSIKDRSFQIKNAVEF
jgi:hypothetical protein